LGLPAGAAGLSAASAVAVAAKRAKSVGSRHR
jgi:hypothetical protein